MIWNNHKILEGSHAFMSASQHSWLNYDEDKLLQVYMNRMAALKGTELHDFASKAIKLEQKLPKSNKTINMFVNDAIGYKMESEKLLYYSMNCFGTTDAISFRKNLLRIHDLKTGVGPTHMEQLYIYTALFCLEYHIKPETIMMETRIYQNDEIVIDNPTADIIAPIMDKIVTFDKALNRIKESEDI